MIDEFDIKPAEDAPLDDLPVYDLSGPINSGISAESNDVFNADSLVAGSNASNRSEVIYLCAGHNKESVKSFDVSVPAGQEWLYGSSVLTDDTGNSVTLTATNLHQYLQYAYNGYSILRQNNTSQLTSVTASDIDALQTNGKMTVLEASMLKLTKDFIVESPSINMPDTSIVVSNPAGSKSGYRGDILEYERNWQLCIYVKAKLEALGYVVNMCRSSLDADGEGTNGEYERAMAANSIGANLLVSLHTGDSMYTQSNVSAVVYKSNDLATESQACSARIAGKLESACGLAMAQNTVAGDAMGTLPGAKDTILNWANMPALTVELNLFGRSSDEAALYDGNLSNYANAIATGIDEYFGYSN